MNTFKNTDSIIKAELVHAAGMSDLPPRGSLILIIPYRDWALVVTEYLGGLSHMEQQNPLYSEHGFVFPAYSTSGVYLIPKTYRIWDSPNGISHDTQESV